MSVLIRDMEMPTSCRACLYSRTDIRNVDWCVLTEKDLPCDCPLVPVPHHGRLIDADALTKQIKRDGIASDPFVKIVCDYFKDAPTIIPADGNMDTEFWGEEYAEAKGLAEEGE